MATTGDHHCSKQRAGNLRKEVTGALGHTFLRVEVKAGNKSGLCSEDFEKFVVVMSGAYRIELPEGPLVLSPQEMVRIPSGTAHRAEALQDTVLLTSQRATKKPAGSERRLADQDNDQYLWGV